MMKSEGNWHTFICKVHKKSQETRTNNENGSCSLLFVNKGFKNVNGVIKLGFGFGVLRELQIVADATGMSASLNIF